LAVAKHLPVLDADYFDACNVFALYGVKDNPVLMKSGADLSHCHIELDTLVLIDLFRLYR
jgi:hypothetical protein